jgi:ferredoxin
MDKTQAKIEQIREIAARLLRDAAVDMVIGFKEGTIPLMTTPFAARSVGDVELLTWNTHCRVNLARYLTDLTDCKGKVAVVAKGCDSRSIVNHLAEGKIRRENLVIIGVPCDGMVDRYNLSARFGAAVERIVALDEETLVVQGGGQEKKFPKAELLRRNCRVCVQRNPVLYDELVGDRVEPPTDIDRFAEVAQLEILDIEQRWRHFETLVAPCIRCYACRDACPTCYCPTCFVDEAQPQWVGKTDEAPDVMTFHILRAFHTAGRCTDCGACVSACPMGIDLRAFTRKLEKDCLELWGWEAGQDAEVRPALETYRPNDPEDNFK